MTPIPRHLWLRYRVLSDGVGFPLPERLLELNVHDTPSTKKVMEGSASSPQAKSSSASFGRGERVTHLHHPGSMSTSRRGPSRRPHLRGQRAGRWR